MTLVAPYVLIVFLTAARTGAAVLPAVSAAVRGDRRGMDAQGVRGEEARVRLDRRAEAREKRRARLLEKGVAVLEDVEAVLALVAAPGRQENAPHMSEVFVPSCPTMTALNVGS
jgi:hypothetical protein